jgi:hypothetical protein
MNAAEKFAQDSLITMAAATLLAGGASSDADDCLPSVIISGHAGISAYRTEIAAAAVAQARAIYNAATDARIKGDTQ